MVALKAALLGTGLPEDIGSAAPPKAPSGEGAARPRPRGDAALCSAPHGQACPIGAVQGVDQDSDPSLGAGHGGPEPGTLPETRRRPPDRTGQTLARERLNELGMLERFCRYCEQWWLIEQFCRSSVCFRGRTLRCMACRQEYRNKRKAQREP